MNPLFKKRKSVRNFLEEEIEKEKIEEILKVIESSPSAGNLKAREVLIIKEKDLKEKLSKVSFNQRFISQAPVVFVFFALPEKSEKVYGERGRNLYSLQDATIACAYAWLEAVSLGLSACWVGAFEEEKIKEILKVPDDWRPISLLPVGYSGE
ncbi:MAG: nitroreductase family protein [Minisyncoccia bacterium]